MGYPKEITETIVLCWGKGYTAQETVEYIQKIHKKSVSKKTVYRHRHSLTAQEIIEELMRQQLRDIALCQSPTAKMKYRDKLLDKLIPKAIEMKTEGTLNLDGLEGAVNKIIDFSRKEDAGDES
jgi:hypothetical protein